MPIQIRTGDDGEIEGGWDVPLERYTLAFWSLLIGPLAITVPLTLIASERLTVAQQRLLGLLLAPPLILVSAVTGWRVGEYFWPSRPLSEQEIDEWREASNVDNGAAMQREHEQMQPGEKRYWFGWGLSLLGTILRYTSGYRRQSRLGLGGKRSWYFSAVLYVLLGLLLLAGYLRHGRSGRSR